MWYSRYMLSLQKKAIRLLAALLAVFLNCCPPVFADDENLYKDLTVTEAVNLVNRLLANQSLITQLSAEMKNNLAGTPAFQEAIDREQRLV